ncbi:hypothetical protein GCM10023210_04080 [Chryseobacterium ginsengisoli]|uniref:Lipoprotein n=1 Tax=Chryseobacterium ginsengisoli TaxID=363853 RepID=A0ABP9LVL6_9FLAO
MKAKIMLLIVFSGFILCCRSKNKITVDYKEDRKETEKVKVDSLGFQGSKSIQNTSADILQEEKKDEVSGEILIKGKSDLDNPFIFNNIVGRDTIQRISIVGTAEYSISNYYTKVDNKKSEVIKEESANSIQNIAQNAVSKEATKEITAKISEETKKIKANGFEAGAWITITIVSGIFIVILFAYKYFKK